MRQSKNLSANKCVVNHPVMKRNPSQKRAIAHLSGPMMVLAGPGSGKTSVIVERTAHMIHEGKIPASSVLVVTFSRAAAVEMKERFLKFTGVPRTGVTFGTFHGVFYGILKQAYGLNGSNILSEEEKYAILRELAVNCATEQSQEGDFVEDLAKEISVVKGGRISLEHYYSSCCPDEVFRQIFKGYRKVLNPSQADLEVTRRVFESGELLGIHLLDHIIIGDHRYISFREKGIFDEYIK